MSQSLVWYHGTNAPKFDSWGLPAPAKDVLCPRSPALFFTQDFQYAKRTGANTCEVTLSSGAKFLQPGSGEQGSDALRISLMNDPMYGQCQHLVSQQLWEYGWQSGDVMRYSFSQAALQALIKKTLVKVVPLIMAAGYPVPAQNVLHELAVQYTTREWIDLICEHAKRLGYQALIGAEVDCWYGPNKKVAMPPKVRSWMAVLDTSVITSPHWI